MQLTPPPPRFSFSTDLEESQTSSLAMIGGGRPPLPPGYATARPFSKLLSLHLVP